MACLKCGKETEEKQVFCQECRQVMEKYPVKPGTAVQFQAREPKPQEKKGQKRKEQDPKLAVLQLKRLVRWLTAVIALLTFVICILAGLLVHALDEPPVPEVDIGRNYTTDTTLRPEG